MSVGHRRKERITCCAAAAAVAAAARIVLCLALNDMSMDVRVCMVYRDILTKVSVFELLSFQRSKSLHFSMYRYTKLWSSSTHAHPKIQIGDLRCWQMFTCNDAMRLSSNQLILPLNIIIDIILISLYQSFHSHQTMSTRTVSTVLMLVWYNWKIYLRYAVSGCHAQA